MSRATVAIVTPYYAPHVGGVQRYAERLAKEVRRSPDLQPIVITTGSGRRIRHESRDGIPVVRLPVWLTLSNTPVNPLWYFSIRRLLRRLHVDVVNAHAPVPLFADMAILAAGRRPVAFTYHAGSMVKHAGRVDLLLAGYERHLLTRLFRRSDAVIAVSRTSLASSVPGAHTVNPGVDLEKITPSQQPWGSTLLYVGRLDRSSAWKGVDVLVLAFAQLVDEQPDARLRIVGSGDARDDLAQLARSLGVGGAVEFAGELHGPQLVQAYQQARALVLPSLTEAESFGMTLLEAMAAGRPVVGSAVGGIPEVVDPEVTGLLVPPGDPDALAAACRRLLTDDALCAVLGRNGRRVVEERFAWPTLLARYLSILRELADAENRTARSVGVPATRPLGAGRRTRVFGCRLPGADRRN